MMIIRLLTPTYRKSRQILMLTSCFTKELSDTMNYFTVQHLPADWPQYHAAHQLTFSPHNSEGQPFPSDLLSESPKFSITCLMHFFTNTGFLPHICSAWLVSLFLPSPLPCSLLCFSAKRYYRA